MASSDDGTSGDGFGFRQVIARHPPWWVATLYGPFLRPEGVTARSRTLAGLTDALDALYPHDKMQLAAGTSGIAYHADICYDFEPGVNAGRDAFIAARSARSIAAAVYSKHGRAVAEELVRNQGATLADVASVLQVSRWEAARLVAGRPRLDKPFDAHLGRRHRLREHAPAAVAYAARTAAVMARIIVADALREARRRSARRSES
jgi:hypothetical protein